MDGRLSATLVLGFAEDGRDGVILGEDLGVLAGLFGEVAEGLGLFVFSGDTANGTASDGSSAVGSPAAGIAISPPPNVIVVSALDPDVILSDVDRSLRLITCVRACC